MIRQLKAEIRKNPQDGCMPLPLFLETEVVVLLKVPVKRQNLVINAAHVHQTAELNHYHPPFQALKKIRGLHRTTRKIAPGPGLVHAGDLHLPVAAVHVTQDYFRDHILHEIVDATKIARFHGTFIGLKPFGTFFS